MKKVNFIAVALLFGGAALAQSNWALTTQNGSGHLATVDQIGLDNDSEVLQGHSNNTATVNQNGEVNWSYLEQVNGPNITATIDQDGDENTSNLKQHGMSNWASVEQVGDNNVLKNSKLSAGLAPYAKQMSGGPGDHNVLDLYQEGDDNEAGVNQEHGRNDAYITQDGSFNQADVYQKQGAPYFGIVNTTTIDVAGDDNWTESYQEGENNTATINITGSGNGNTATGAVGDDWISTYQKGDGNTSLIDINGNYNDADVSQTGVGGHDATVMQMGDYNLGTIDQDGSNHVGDIDQNGSSNTAFITQNN